MWFVAVFGRANSVLENVIEVPERHVLMMTAAMMLLAFRKPPDKLIKLTEDLMLEVKSGSEKFEEKDGEQMETIKMMRKAMKEMEPEPHALAGEKQTGARDMGSWDTDSLPIVVDSATTRTITPRKSDLKDVQPYKADLHGIGDSQITHKGKVSWKILDDNGQEAYLEDDVAYYSPGCPYRLLCPSSWKETRDKRRYENGEIEGDKANMRMCDDTYNYILTWDQGRRQVTAPLDPNTRLPVLQSVPTYSGYCSFEGAFCMPATVSDDEDEDNDKMAMEIKNNVKPTDQTMSRKPKKVSFQTNHEKIPVVENIDEPLTPRDEALFLRYHQRLGHMPFSVLRQAAKMGILPRRLQNCRNVVCPACLYGKQKRRPWRTKAKEVKPIKKVQAPGECVSVDQLESRLPGLRAQTTGRLTKERYSVATVFVDHFSDLDYVHVQASTNADDTIEGKKAFENFCKERGVEVKHYHADNGIFASRAFRAEVQRCGQTLSFCGVGAHHQNGVAERRIQDLSDSARSSMCHAARHNPAVTAHLWPYALRHASYARRILPRLDKSRSPDELFNKSEVRPNLRFIHPFGCPVYVLNEKLQSGKKLPKWNMRSRVGVYLGPSMQHASSVSLILNPQTGYVSPQFHCVFDDAFDSSKKDTKFETVWARKAGLLLDRSAQEEENDYSRVQLPPSLSVPFAIEDIQVSQKDQSPEEIEDNDVFQEQWDNDQGYQLDDDEDVEPIEVEPRERPNDNDDDEPEVKRTRAGREIKPTRRLKESYIYDKLKSFVAVFGFPASIADNDTMYLKEAMQQPDRGKFLEAMIKEIEDHTTRGHWRITTRQEMKERGYKHHPIMAIWSFKRKRSPAGEILKYKARLCCHGGQTIKGVHYQESFSPVVAWSTVRMMMTMAIIQGWHARQIDFVLAFPQANVRTDIYMRIPEKFEVQKGKLTLNEHAKPPSKQEEVVKLIKNVYGLVDASYTWHLHLKKGLQAEGFEQSKVDPCLFYKKDFIFILYVDDAICMSPDSGAALKLIEALKKRKYVLTDEGDVSAYLGLQIEHVTKTKVSLKQPAFIQRIIDQVGLKDARMHSTPADTVLGRDKEGQERKNEFHYRSIIGQLNYLSATTRPEIQFAVHQCARFSSDPKMSHEKAVKRIIRYLKETKEEGLVLNVDKEKGIECYVDADFAGCFQKEKPDNPRDCLSRTGYIIKYAGCPIIWTSRLQSKIALSTTEAEYMALSTAMREVIFVKNLLEEMRAKGVQIIDKKPVIKCKVFEDNSGAIELSKLPKLRPRTKHIAIEYHHFRTLTVRGLNGEDPEVDVEYIQTELQQADIMTKPVPRQQFQHLRKLLCGW